MRRSIIGPLFLGLAATTDACRDAADVDTVVHSVAMQHTVRAVALGASVQLVAIAYGVQGVPVGVPITWTSSDPSIGGVNATGGVTGRRMGSVDITAIAGSHRASVTLEVIPARIELVRRSPGPVVEPGEFVEFEAILLDAVAGRLVPDTPIQWSADPAADVVVTPLDPPLATKVRVVSRVPRDVTLTAFAHGVQGTQRFAFAPAGVFLTDATLRVLTSGDWAAPLIELRSEGPGLVVQRIEIETSVDRVAICGEARLAAGALTALFDMQPYHFSWRPPGAIDFSIPPTAHITILSTGGPKVLTLTGTYVGFPYNEPGEAIADVAWARC